MTQIAGRLPRARQPSRGDPPTKPEVHRYPCISAGAGIGYVFGDVGVAVHPTARELELTGELAITQ